jgi:antitoxin MazE
MKFAKWGNSVAVRIPAEVAEKLGFRLGEPAQFAITRDNKLQIGRDRSREEAIEKMKSLRFVVPGDFKFDRDEIYDN